MPDPTCPRPGEYWLPVVGFESYYEVSDWGRVRSLDRITATRTGQTIGHWRHYKGRVLRQTFTKMGDYPKVAFSVNGEYTYHRVHHLVLEAFAGPCPEGMESLHGPGGSRDNHWLPDNSGLHWGTRSENMMDKVRDGTSNRGERQGSHKLTEAGVLDIRARRARKEPAADVAACYGITAKYVGEITAGRRWGWLTEDPAA